MESESSRGPRYRTGTSKLRSRDEDVLYGTTDAPGDAVIVYSGDLSKTTPIRWVLQAITIGYQGGAMVRAAPADVYRAVRSALAQAEVLRLGTVATYLMAARPGYGTAPPEVMAALLCQAIVDHAAKGSQIQEIRSCETDSARLKIASDALRLVLALHAARAAVGSSAGDH